MRVMSCARSRAHVAVLKLAAGRLDALRSAIDQARLDYRDVLAWAEYSTISQSPASARLTLAERRRMIDRDWRQYGDWLNR